MWVSAFAQKKDPFEKKRGIIITSGERRKKPKLISVKQIALEIFLHTFLFKIWGKR